MAFLAWSADGRSIASGTSLGYFRIWDVTSAEPRSGVLTAPGLVTGLALSADGRRLYASVSDFRLHVWDVPSGRELGYNALSLTELPYGLTLIPPDGTVLAAVEGGRLETVDTDPDRAADRACRDLGRNMNPDEWATYLPTEPFRPTCS